MASQGPTGGGLSTGGANLLGGQHLKAGSIHHEQIGFQVLANTSAFFVCIDFGAMDLPRMKGSAPQKLALAELLWKPTTVSQEWIAEKLAMRSAANVSQQLRQYD